MEAVHCGLPLILTGCLPGQEEGNVSFVLEKGLGTLATRPAEIVRAIGELNADHEREARIRQTMAGLRRPQASHDIARLILSTCLEAGERVPEQKRDS